MTISELIDTYLAARSKRWSPRSIELNRAILTRLATHIGPTKPADQLTTSDLHTYLATRRHLAPNPWNLETGTIRRWLTWCRNTGHLPPGQICDDDLTPIRAPRRDFHHLTPQQLADAINATENPRDRCFIATAITTGLRTSDLINLRLSNINLDNATITLRIQKTDVETVKPIPIELDRELRRWLTHYEELKIHPQAAATPKHQWHLFPRFYTNPTDGTYIADPAHGLTTRSARNIAHKTLQKIGIQWHGECLHLFRRSAARVFFDQLAASGHDTALLATRAFLDHSSVAVTEKYIGLNTERQFVINSLARKPFLPQQQTAPAAEAAGAEERNIHETNDNTMRRLRLTRRR